VARGTQHRKRRPAQDARAAVVAAPRKQRPPQWQEQLFFQRLRVHAKWMFVLLAVVFALGFVVFGVGSGSGVGQVLQNFFSNSSGGSGASIGSLEHKVAKHPDDASAWRDLATAYEQKQRTQDAVTALQRYTALRPKDAGALSELASQYTSLAQQKYGDYANAAQEAQLAAPQSTFAPPATTPLGKAFSSPTGLQDPIAQVVGTNATTAAQSAYSAYQTAQTEAEATYRKVTALTPNDVTAQFQLGEAAQQAGDLKTAEQAYERFLKLSPNDVDAPQVRAVLKEVKAQLKAQSAPPAHPSASK
jgi:cytochrome c-type biogenesis protein CcmH/NrfG